MKGYMIQLMKNKVIKKDFIINFILILFLFEPTIFVKYNMCNNIYIVGGLISCFYIVAIYIKKNIKLNKMILYLILFRIINIFSTVLYNGDLLKVGYTSMTIVTLFLYANYYYSNKDFDEFINVLYKIFSIFLFVNLITYICYPQGINPLYEEVYFLGIRTRFTEYAISGALLAYINYRNKKIKKTSLFSAIIIAFLNIVIPKISTGFIGIICFIIFVVVLNNTVKDKFDIKFNVLQIPIYIFIIAIVFFRIHTYFDFIIVDVLGKDLTLTGRTEIWDSAIETIKKSNIWIGNGYSNHGNFAPYGINDYYQAHNQILQLLYECGIIGITLFLIFINSILKTINNPTTQYDIVIVSVIYAFLVMMISEIYSYYIASYIPLILFFYRKGIFCNERSLNEDKCNNTSL